MSSLTEGFRRRSAGWRRFTIYLVLLVVLAVAAYLGRESERLQSLPSLDRQIIEWGIALAWFVVGALVVNQLRRTVNAMAARHPSADIRVLSVVNRALSAVGYAFVLVIGLNLLQVKVGSILVGGAVTGVIVGVGAQSTLANLIAGLVLFAVRPFQLGEYVSFRTYLFGGVEYSGTVVDVNWYHTILEEGGVRRVLPNASVVSSAITVGAREGNKLCTVPLPYAISFRDFEAKMSEMTGGRATLAIREFGTDTYTVQVEIPAEIDLEVIREAIAAFRAQG
ncbi:mechanosensitive ion channel family protein [Alicyclobacillus acidocaldarius]|uniref:mechanosensitive ion channel family protein n=1 Tax=Alicyclobacillus acidocaldarius TaxID=405212 RepID=UPI001FE115A6|nr:mechanosensitive ion channel family protein [Alicyclobacillus acidocaldarius]